MEASKRVPVLYLDIDDTVRKGYDTLGRFVNRPEEVELFDGMKELLLGYKTLGWRIIGVSNQGGIALGHVTREDVVAAMTMTDNLAGGAFDNIIFCPHHPNATGPEESICWCRKPRAGMVFQATYELAEKTGEAYATYMSLFVGDRFEDEQCAQAANLRFLGASEWRTGSHLEMVRDQAASKVAKRVPARELNLGDQFEYANVSLRVSTVDRTRQVVIAHTTQFETDMKVYFKGPDSVYDTPSGATHSWDVEVTVK